MRKLQVYSFSNFYIYLSTRNFLSGITNLIGPMTAIQWLRKIPPFRGIYNKVRKDMSAFREILSNVISNQR